MKLLNIIIPCHNEENNIDVLFKELIKSLEGVLKRIERLSIIFVDDGSTDKTLECIKKLSHEKVVVHYLSFTKNFGKEAAIMAGLTVAVNGLPDSYTAIMDADLQDPPFLLNEMIKILETDPDIMCVGARRVTRRGEPVIRSLFSKAFYKIYNYISEVSLVDGVRDFRMMRYEMLRTIICIPEVTRFSKGLFSWTGYRTSYLEYENVSREGRISNWSFGKLMKYALDGVISFSPRLLEISSFFGVLSCFAAAILIFYFAYQKLLQHIPVQGYAMVVCLILLIGGIQLLCIGIIGQYISKVFLEVKRRPLYVIREEGNAGEKNGE